MTTSSASTSTPRSGRWSHPGDHLAEAAQVVSELSIADKATLCQGFDNWRTHAVPGTDIPAVWMADGPHGMRTQPDDGEHLGLSDSLPATCFPTASALAATWDLDLIRQVGAAIGREARAQGVDIVLGPGANIKRSPLCGRNFEYFSEDPHLSGQLAAAHIHGVQSTGAGTSLKHFVANNQEHRRLTIDAIIDERALREIYLASFEAPVRQSEPWTLMCSYNRVNGTYSSDNAWLLDTVLRDEWGHRGIVVTDWGAMNDRVAAIAAGCELEMPGPVHGAADRLAAAVADGTLDEALLDRAATRLVAIALAARANRDPDAGFGADAHHDLARLVAAQAVVLLRNVDDALPIGDDDTVALVGEMAVEPRYQGTGSSRINPTRLDNLRDELTKLLGADRVTWVPGTNGTIIDEVRIDEAVAAAADVDIVVVHVGLPDNFENEGNDRTNLGLPDGHNALVAALAAAHDRVAVVLTNGSPVTMPWLDDVEAVVEGYLGGQAGAGGLADVLSGVIAPSGRLAETFPRSLDDVPAQANFPGGPRTVEYREGIWVGYRHTVTADADVLFPFGHGLTYGTIEVGAPSLDRDTVTVDELADGATVTVTVPLANPTDRDLAHVVQVYVHDHDAAVPRPRRELKVFTKVGVTAGQSTEATVELDLRSFAFWDVVDGAWTVEGGTFTIEVGNSATDIVATVDLQVEGPALDRPVVPAALATPARHMRVTRTDFAAVLGHEPPASRPYAKPYDANTPMEEVRGTAAGKALAAMVDRWVRGMLGDDDAAEPLIQSMVNENPVRSVLMGGASLDELDAIVAALNGDFTSGAKIAMDRIKATFARAGSDNDD